MITDDAEKTSLDFSEATMTASKLYAQSFLQDLLRRPRAGKHAVARALRGKARVAKRKAKRKA